MAHLFRTTLKAGMIAVSLAACSGDSTGPDLDELAGEYILFTINGQSLPVIVDQFGNDIVEITQGSVSLESNGTFDDVTQLRITQSGVVTTEVDVTQGTWEAVGTTVTFRPTDGSGTYTMTWDGQLRLTQLFQGFTLVYEREPPLTAHR
jgi:hypothetical protein